MMGCTHEDRRCCKANGVSKSIIRYYEGKGVLPHAERDAAGYRSYGLAQPARIRFVTGVRQLGCSFPEIRALIAVQELRHAPSGKLLNVLASKIVEVDDQMERLRQMQKELTRLQHPGSMMPGFDLVPRS